MDLKTRSLAVASTRMTNSGGAVKQGTALFRGTSIYLPD